MMLITIESILNRTGFTEDEIKDLMSKGIFPSPCILKHVKQWDLDDVEKFCIFNGIKPKEIK